MPKAKSDKSGARHNAKDQEKVQGIHDHAVGLGADCPSSGKSAALKAIPAGVDPGYYAQSEGWDIARAASVLAGTAELASAEIDDADTTEIAPLVVTMRALVAFISGEIDDLEEGAQADGAESMSADMPDSDTPATYPASVVDISAGKTTPISFAYIKSLHLPHDEQFYRDVIAVKSVARDTIRGYSMLWGSPDLVDVERDFFTRQSDFWDAQMGKSARPLTWDHAQDPATKSAPVIGEIAEFGDDDLGRWYVGQLSRAHQYRKAIDKLISRRDVGTSSDSAPQYVVREPAKSGAFWLKQWPWFASALTPTPAEPRMFDAGSVYWKSLGLTLPAAPDGARRSGESGPGADALRDYEYLKLTI